MSIFLEEDKTGDSESSDFEEVYGDKGEDNDKILHPMFALIFADDESAAIYIDLGGMFNFYDITLCPPMFLDQALSHWTSKQDNVLMTALQ